MSLNNIELPPFVLQQLYTKTLVSLDTEKIAVTPSIKTSFSTLGNNQKNIAILVNSDDALYLPEDQLNFLTGILAACKLTMADVAILNIKKNSDITYTSINAALNAEKVFLFGVTSTDIALPLPLLHYQIESFNNQTYLAAPLLNTIQSNKEEKTQLWNCLKQIFSI